MPVRSIDEKRFCKRGFARELPTYAILFLCLIAWAAPESSLWAQQVPTFVISQSASSIQFEVNASIEIKGTFDQWNASLTFGSTDVRSARLDVEIQAASVDTGSGIKNSKLKGEDFFYVDQNPLITFKSTKVVQTGPTTFELDGDFTIRGVTKPEKLTLDVSGKGTGQGVISGTMKFDRRDYGMNGSIPFMRIANHVEVTFALQGTRVSGPPVVFQQ
jgi:polyisoprenoid-binding protein YceI